MYRTVPKLVRSQGNLLKGILGKGGEKEVAAKQLTAEEQESLRKTLPSIRAREATQVSVASESVTDLDEDLFENRIDTDAIRARGFLKYTQNYTPSSNVKSLVLEVASECLRKAQVQTENVEQFKFADGDNSLKFELLSQLGQSIKHWPTNGKLLHLETVADVINFYQEPVKNVTKYTEIARDETNPKNVSIMEQAVRFHPEDTHMYHGGVTAFPGSGGEVISLRQKRLLRQFQPKKEWFDYEDLTYDYTRPDKNMPWDPEVAKQMDKYTDKRYNLKTKQFTRIQQ
uniref:Large ribosomal subunit protein mL50 n=1 Tax=Caenorhabditis tropicalis TaxID=1561998 RepID=A0A1I7UYT7_9PELO